MHPGELIWVLPPRHKLHSMQLLPASKHAWSLHNSRLRFQNSANDWVVENGMQKQHQRAWLAYAGANARPGVVRPAGVAAYVSPQHAGNVLHAHACVCMVHVLVHGMHAIRQ